MSPLIAVHSPFLPEKVVLACAPPFVVEQGDLIVRLLRDEGLSVARWNGLDDATRASLLAGLIETARAEVARLRK